MSFNTHNQHNYSYQPNINMPTPIARRKTMLKPPVSQIERVNHPNNPNLVRDRDVTYNQDSSGIKFKRFPGPYWGNTIYETTNRMGFDNYYDAMAVQNLLNAGFCESEILENVPTQPVYVIPGTNRDTLGYSTGSNKEPIQYTPMRMMNYQKDDE